MTQEKSADAQDPLTPTRADAIHAGIKVGVATIPFFGGVVAELFEAIIGTPISKRRDAFLTELDKRLRQLEKTGGFTLEDLSQNETFISTFMEIMPIVIRNHRREKLKALQNAVLNAALPTAPDDNLQKMFTQLLDELTVWHLQILGLISYVPLPQMNLERSDWTMNSEAITDLTERVELNFPEMAGQLPIYIQIIKDLHAKGLIANHFPRAGMLTKIEHQPEITSLGKNS